MPRLPHPRASLSGFADARLPAWRRAVVAHHLLRCTRCAVEVAQVRALKERLRQAPPPPGPPPALVDRLLALGGEVGGRETGPQVPPVVPPLLPVGEAPPAGVGAAGVLVASVLVLGAVVAGSAATGVPLPWPSATARASVTSVLPRLWSEGTEAPGGPAAEQQVPGGAGTGRPVDNGPRP